MSSIELVKKLLKAIEETDVTEIFLQDESMKVRIRRGHGMDIQPTSQPVQRVALSPEPTIPRQEAASATLFPSGAAGSKENRPSNYIAVTCPFVGTFYRSAAPGAPPFVEEGQEVQPGKVLCIVEAMKLMNEIESEKHARVAKILVENGSPVEYGQELLLLEVLG